MIIIDWKLLDNIKIQKLKKALNMCTKILCLMFEIILIKSREKILLMYFSFNSFLV